MIRPDLRRLVEAVDREALNKLVLGIVGALADGTAEKSGADFVQAVEQACFSAGLPSDAESLVEERLKIAEMAEDALRRNLFPLAVQTLGIPEGVDYTDCLTNIRVSAGTLRILKQLRSHDLEDDTLDDLVFDCASQDGSNEVNSTSDDVDPDEIHSKHEDRASEVNQGGLEDQVEFLVERWGETEALKAILEQVA